MICVSLVAGEITVSRNLDYEETSSFEFTVRATLASNTIECSVTINVKNLNEVPYWETETETPTTYEIVEESEMSTPIGIPIRAKDEDLDSELVFAFTEEQVE